MGTTLFAAKLRAGDQRAIGRVRRALDAHDGNVTKAAVELGVSRNALTQWRNADDPRHIPALIPLTPATPGRPASADYYRVMIIEPPLGCEYHAKRVDAIVAAQRAVGDVELICDRNGRVTDSTGTLRALVRPKVGARKKAPNSQPSKRKQRV